jgi:hypothetical protein
MSQNMLNKFYVPAVSAGLMLAGFMSPASASVINFDDQGLTGPSLFSSAGPAQTIPITVDGVTATFKGGVILTEATNLPANRTSIYGTASFANNLSNPLTITFDKAITNFLVDVLNGNTEPIDYTISDNAGNSSTFNLPNNLNGGKTQIGFAATGNEVTIKSSIGSQFAYDFFIDNIRFNEPLPPSLGGEPVPEPLTILGSVVALGMGGIFKKQHSKRLQTQKV